MFNKKEMEINVDFDVIVGSNTKIDGTIDSEGSIRIDGLLNGDIRAVGDVIIGANAEINGNINSKNIDISGIVNGNIVADLNLKIYETGRLNGDFECSSFHISDGGFFQGKCTVKGNVKKSNQNDSDLDNNLKDEKIESDSYEIDTPPFNSEESNNSNNSKKHRRNSR